ncbi:MAG: PD-(D/E)XK nuclease family protein [Desulfamplus sp.]|nr:PD-(D/E)XK nuclease family protein [Desulfamplus sp.]
MLYVAVTRSIHACWLGIGVMGTFSAKSGEKNTFHRSGFGCLLSGNDKLEAEIKTKIKAAELPEKLNELKADCLDINIENMPVFNHQYRKQSLEQYEPQNSQTELGQARNFHGSISRQWWITSYSGMLAGAHMPLYANMPSYADKTVSPTFSDMAAENALNTPESPVHDQLQEYASEIPVSPKINPSDRTIHTFPRGPEAGTFLHDLMEWVALEGFSRIASDRQYLWGKIKNMCARRGWEDWVDLLTQWLEALLNIPLPLSDKDILLANLLPQHCQAEMEFMFSVNKVNTKIIDDAIHSSILPGMVRPVLKSNILNGMLKGFIDLVFYYNGQYFVMDYKSNYLGQTVKAYNQTAMQHAMLEHRYDLQYVLYTLALHRLLKSRLGDRYHYNQHVGGVIYLFLRGVNLESVNNVGDNKDSHGIYFDKPPFDLIDMLDNCCKN